MSQSNKGFAFPKSPLYSLVWHKMLHYVMKCILEHLKTVLHLNWLFTSWSSWKSRSLEIISKKSPLGFLISLSLTSKIPVVMHLMLVLWYWSSRSCEVLNIQQDFISAYSEPWQRFFPDQILVALLCALFLTRPSTLAYKNYGLLAQMILSTHALLEQTLAQFLTAQACTLTMTPAPLTYLPEKM